MSFQDGKYEVYVIGYSKDMDYVNKTYVEKVLNAHGFNLCKNIEGADFILDTGEHSGTMDSVNSLEYAKRDYIEVAESLGDLLYLRALEEDRECEIV